MARGKKTGGRQIGSGNLIGRTARENIGVVFAKIGGIAAMARWAKKNPGAFYTIYRVLVPHEHTGEGGGPIKTIAVHDHFDLPDLAK